jgi:hypothetical protein
MRRRGSTDRRELVGPDRRIALGGAPGGDGLDPSRPGGTPGRSGRVATLPDSLHDRGSGGGLAAGFVLGLLGGGDPWVDADMRLCEHDRFS